jgi:hypothetical protein
MDRMVLRDDQWERIAPLVPGKVGDPGRSGPPMLPIPRLQFGNMGGAALGPLTELFG